MMKSAVPPSESIKYSQRHLSRSELIAAALQQHHLALQLRGQAKHKEHTIPTLPALTSRHARHPGPSTVHKALICCQACLFVPTYATLSGRWW